MRKKRVFSNLAKRNFRPEIVMCPACKTRLRRFATLSQKTVITLQGPIYAVHCGYRCPKADCNAVRRVYRSAECDALALPGFTFGLDVVVLIGHLKLARHQTLDEVHQNLCEKLAAFETTISRREVMYLFEAYCQLLQAAQQQKSGPEWEQWIAQVRENGGLIVSIDGIQPDKGNETIYLVRDVLTGRLLNAQNVTNSDAQTLTKVLQPVVELGLPVVGAISDAQVSEILAIAQLWPDIPHQTCQFHYLREAGRPIFEEDRKIRTGLRKDIQNKLRESRRPTQRRLQELKSQSELTQVSKLEQDQLEILEDYALSIQTALNFDGSLPFDYPGLKGYSSLEAIEESLQQVNKKGALLPGIFSKSWRDCLNWSGGVSTGKGRSSKLSECKAGYMRLKRFCQGAISSKRIRVGLVRILLS